MGKKLKTILIIYGLIIFYNILSSSIPTGLRTCSECNPYFVNINGDTMTGPLSISKDANDSNPLLDLTNTNNGTGASSQITLTNDIGKAGSLGMASSNFNLFENASNLFGLSSLGVKIAIVSIASDFEVFTGYPVLRRMRVASNGNTYFYYNVDVSGNITAENVFIPTHAFGATNITQTVAVADTWYTINWSYTHIEGPWTGNSTHMIVSDAGHYVTCYGANFHDDSANPDSNNALRVNVNGVEQNHSYIEVDIRNRNRDIWLRNCVWAKYQVGDAVSIQYISSNIAVTINSDCTYSPGCNYAFADMLRVT